MYRKEPWEWAIIAGFAVLSLAFFALVAWAFLTETWEIEFERRVEAPPAAVFAALVEADSRVAWAPNLLDLAPLTGEPGEVGATRLLFMGREGRRWQEEERQIAYEPPALWSVSRDGPEAKRNIELRLEPGGDGATRLVWKERVRFKELENRLLAPLTLRDRRCSLSGGLDRMASLSDAIEDNGAVPPDGL